MNFAEIKKQEMEEYLSEKHKFGKPKNIVEYSRFTKERKVGDEIKTIWTEAFRVALQENAHIYVPQGKYYLDDTVVIPSDRKITADKNAFVCITEEAKVVMFRNADVIDGSFHSVGMNAPYTENVCIEGGMWATEYASRAGYGVVGAFDVEDSMHGVHALMLFSGVKNLWIKNVTFYNTVTFALQIGRTENFLIEGVRLDTCHADGVHLNGEIKNGVVYDVRGYTRDDLVALNAYDWDNSTINNGTMERITVSKICSTGDGAHCMRFLSGVTREEMGNIDCYMKDIHVSDIEGVQTFKLYLQTPSYVGAPEGTKVGRIENITFENIEIVKNTFSDGGQNYFDKDPVTGHFGVFEMNSNIHKIAFRDIRFRLDMPEYDETAHFITVGPKSCYREDVKVETFDPYISSVVDEIEYENIIANGKSVEDLSDYIRVIKFENLYPSAYASGCGKIKKITKKN